MTVNSLLIDAGARPSKDPKWTSIATPRFMGGYFSQRNPLQDPSETAVARFYGGKPDVHRQASVRSDSLLWCNLSVRRSECFWIRAGNEHHTGNR
jgi:hypothetical protein